MALVWADLSSGRDLERKKEWIDRAREAWSRFGPGAGEVDQNALRKFDRRLSLTVCESRWSVRYEDRPARPLAELFASAAPASWGVTCGLVPKAFENARSAAEEESGLGFHGWRVRVGVTRGHLLEVVVSVPLDERASEEQLQVAAEILLEHCVGDRSLDDWVASVGVSRSARRSGLLVFRDAGAATDYPIHLVRELVERGIAGLEAARARSLLTEEFDGWTALEVPPLPSALQAERLFASTATPEALKAALEGMPFHSGRFTAGDEIFVWLQWSARSVAFDERARLRMVAEKALMGLGDRGAPMRLVGSGFGPHTDYLDLVVSPNPQTLRQLGSVVAGAAAVDVELGFYDSIWSEERIRFSAG